jgi:hypothetical protein
MLVGHATSFASAFLSPLSLSLSLSLCIFLAYRPAGSFSSSTDGFVSFALGTCARCSHDFGIVEATREAYTQARTYLIKFPVSLILTWTHCSVQSKSRGEVNFLSLICAARIVHIAVRLLVMIYVILHVVLQYGANYFYNAARRAPLPASTNLLPT